MNRRERRIAQKQGRAEGEVILPASNAEPVKAMPTLPIIGDTGKPGLVVRIIGRVLLSQFVLNRVEQPHVLRMLNDVARQAGRMDAVMRIQAKLLTIENT